MILRVRASAFPVMGKPRASGDDPNGEVFTRVRGG